MEDRFWVWVHYGATKLGRGEWFELIDHLSYLRSNVLGPLLSMRYGEQPRGVRKLEQYNYSELEELKKTIPLHTFESCYQALRSTIELYQYLRQPDMDKLDLKKEAEAVSIEYLEKVYSSRS